MDAVGGISRLTVRFYVWVEGGALAQAPVTNDRRSAVGQPRLRRTSRRSVGHSVLTVNRELLPRCGDDASRCWPESSATRRRTKPQAATILHESGGLPDTPAGWRRYLDYFAVVAEEEVSMREKDLVA